VIACPLFCEEVEPAYDIGTGDTAYDMGTGDTGEFVGGEAMYDSAAEVLSTGAGGGGSSSYPALAMPPPIGEGMAGTRGGPGEGGGSHYDIGPGGGYDTATMPPTIIDASLGESE
jgi:hypothetical protein